MSDLIENLLHLEGRDRQLGCEAATRIRELEAELESARAYAVHERSLGAEPAIIEANDLRQRAEKAESERDVIKAATIERCADFVAAFIDSPFGNTIANHVRALAKPTASKPPS